MTTDLRVRLIALRADALGQLPAGDGIDAGLLHLVVESSAALAALDAAIIAGAVPNRGDRVVVVDDNVTIRLVVYVAAKGLSGWRAIWLQPQRGS